MIQHVVLFRPKASLSELEREALIAALRHAVTGIAAIKRATIGRRILLDRPGYETQMIEHFDYSAVLEFESEGDLRAYLDDAAHADLGRRLFMAAEAMLAYDFKEIPLDQI